MKALLVMRANGRIQSKKSVAGEWLRVGRNASCEIHLPDPRIALEQGMVTHPDAGFIYVEGEAGSQNISRKSVRAVRLQAGQGIAIGPYRMELRPGPPGYDFELEVDLVRPLEVGEDLASRTSLLTLGSLGLTKRWAAWLWALLVLGLFLLLPAGRVLGLPWGDLAQNATFGDRFWNPGPLLLAHQPIEAKCATCHEIAFRHVKDRACLECHAGAGRHVDSAPQQAALFGDARCTTCHRDHKGVKATHRDDDGLCVGCHKDVRAHAREARSANVTDFARDHPQFRISLSRQGVVQRVRQGEGPILQESNLAFSHAVHLDPKGVRSPLKGRMTLECKSCHVSDATRSGFQPISMARNCQECHTLQFEPAVTLREVPHGKPADAAMVIEDFYANLALQGVRDSFQKAFGVPGEGLLRRVGEPTAAERESALALAQRKARKVADDMFEVRVCKTCHRVSRDEGEWRIAPIAAAGAWMPGARFNHKPHLQVKCVECHDVATSKKSSDVAMPTIKVCRECHAGSRPTEGKVTSNCMLCHGFHDPRHPWDPSFTPKHPARTVARPGDAR